ncbi:hypothetical protein SAMN05216184_101558 [Georgenia satyanarayanai]|uniref:Uncharacterized protein n=1 Tax=Georgenia satyanarayanai TaxID=860221 RepID=A0A2Y8ZX51_9MICO|nr:hypothetical protein [Georgenia satyanarayanai]PYG02089.1 hypothetical protein A8987_101558 [Georgenia satyanarayanai]SSA36900.1 hypothetical protein SAMN05216184_101558 [Georgenia satyanarayanai]
MTKALAWLEAPRPTPVAAVLPAPGGLAGERYDGLLVATPGGGLAPVDVLARPASRAWSLRDAVPAGAALSRIAAVWVHTGRLCPERVEVVVDPGRRLHAGAVVHRQQLEEADVVVLGGVPTTTPLRTAVDLLCFTEEQLAVAGACALVLGGLAPPLVHEALTRPGRRAPVRRAMALLAAAEDAARRRRP